jgi:uncharacterized membrane protein (UPF0182 family)
MMDAFLRVIAILAEVLILTALLGCLLYGVWLTLFEVGLREKYKKAIAMALVMVASLAVVFFIAHLAAFYPPA